jgi:Putative adhesin
MARGRAQPRRLTPHDRLGHRLTNRTLLHPNTDSSEYRLTECLKGTVMIDKSFDVSGPITLDLRMSRASITVHEVDDATQAAVRLVPAPGSLDLTDRCTVALSGATLRITMPKNGFEGGGIRSWGRRTDGIDAEITVPSRSSIRIRSFLGTVDVTGTAGDVDIASGSADVTLDYVAGSLRVRQGSGRSELHGVTGSVVVRSGSGDVQIGEASGTVDVVCASGNLDVGVAHEQVRLRAGSGSARVLVANGDVDIVSGSGGVEVGLPAGQVARLDVATGSGQLRTELPVDDQRPPGRRAITVKARTGSGDIRIGRAEPPATAA